MAHLRETVSASSDQIVEFALEALVAEFPDYANLEQSQLFGEIAENVRTYIGWFLTCMVSGELPSDDTLDIAREAASRRAEDGIPFDVLIAGYFRIARSALNRFAEQLDPEDVLTVSLVVLEFLQSVMGAAAKGYSDEHRLQLGMAESRAHQTLEALLSGRPLPVDDVVSGLYGGEIDMLWISVPPHLDQLDADLARADERKLIRRILQEARARSPYALSTLAPGSGATPGGGALLFPAEARAGFVYEETASRLSEAAGTGLVIAFHRCIASEVPNTIELLEDIIEIVNLLDRPPGLYRIDDVVPTYQLTRPGPARDALVSILDPIDEQPELLDTLHYYLSSGGNRRQTALRLSIHPNTVDYRLAKITRMTGFDPLAPIDSARLHAAVIAQRMIAARRRRPSLSRRRRVSNQFTS